MKGTGSPRIKTIDMAYVALFSVLIVICSWISIPTAVPFTMQTFAVFLAVAVLGGRRGTLSVLLYLLMGAIGIPVFSGFMGGIGRLFDVTGGYMIGFLLAAIFMWCMESILGKKNVVLAVSMVIGILLCYAFGTAWFMFLYARNTGAIALSTVIGTCVVPFVIPDVIKICLVLVFRKRLVRVLKLDERN